jgi:sortase A
MKTGLYRKPVSRRTRWLLRWSSHCFLLAAVVALGYCAVVWTHAYLYQAYQSWRFDQMIHGAPTSSIGLLPHQAPPEPRQEDMSTPHAIPQPASPPAGSPKTPPQPSAGTRLDLGSQKVIGRIVIPRVGVSAIVEEGADRTTLSMAVGHIPGTALPGQPGNVGMAGHRDSFFRGLRKIRQNDTITLSTLSGSYHYRVESTQVVEPNDTEVLAATSQPTLTLVTCYPFSYIGSAPERFIVRARQRAQ